MFQSKRFIVATILGFVAGFICLALASGGPSKMPSAIAWQILFSRALIGFTIGISNIKFMHWSLHGMLIGALMSLPMAFSSLMATPEQFSPSALFWFTIILGILYGLLIELVVTKLFKEKTIAV